MFGPRLPFGIRLGGIFDLSDLLNLFRGRNATPGGSFIYVVRDQTGRAKVGVSQDPTRRLRELQTGHPEALELVWCAVTPGDGYSIETVVKRTTRLPRASGEWFLASPDDVITLVSQVAYIMGQPLQPVPVDMVPRIIAIAQRESPQPDQPPTITWLHAIGFVVCLALVIAGGLLAVLA